MNNSNINEPCLVETRQGFSVLYQNKPLYSKYAPKDSIKKIINSLNILPNTLILCFSPLLAYGLEELFEKLPENCFVLALEKNKILYDFSINCLESKISHFLQTENPFFYANPNNPLEIAKLVNNIDSSFSSQIDFPKISNFKRVLPIDFSGGAQFEKEFYQEVTTLLDESISQFWKNRTTLIKLGRLYVSNFFKNLKDILENPKINTLNEIAKKSFGKHILVLGTGLSLDDFLPVLKSKKNYLQLREKLFIIACDASLPVVKKYGITPDIVVGVEGQLAIEKAYVGCKNSKVSFVCDLLSRPSIKRILQGEVAFFLSEYTSESFFKEFSSLAKTIKIPVIEPLGSVGLVALELALYLRSENQNIFCCGTDFSFLPGKTHCKGAPVHTSILLQNTKLNSTEQFSSSFSGGNFYIKGKSSYTKPEKLELTSKVLYNYGQHFENRYSKCKNIFDLSNFGMETNLPKFSLEEFFTQLENKSTQNNDINLSKDFLDFQKTHIEDFFQIQHQKLLEIKQILTGEKEPSNLENLLLDCGYLYLHFPDGHNGLKLTTDFLKRIRAEVEFFLKIT